MSWGEDAYGAAPYGAPGDPPAEAPPPAGASLSLPLRISVVAEQDIALPLRIARVTSRSMALALRVSVVAEQDLLLPAVVTIQSPTVVSHRHWRPVVTLSGVDISHMLTGQIEVEATEGEARIASFSIRPDPGAISLPAWTGARVTIEFAKRAADGSAEDHRRLFTGVVDVPSFDHVEQVVVFECTDQLQQIIRNTPREWIDANVGGYYSTAVSGEPTDTLQYADARLQSVPAALDLDPYQQARVTPWHIDRPADLVLTEADIFDESLSQQMASASDLRNEIQTGLQYRFPRLRARVVAVDFERTIGQYASQGLDIPNRAMIEQALSSMSGWEMRGDINFVPVEPDVYESSGSGGTVYTIITATEAPNLALGFAAGFSSRWVQWVTEDYRVTIRAQASIEAIGRSVAAFDGATLDADFDDGSWLSEPSAEPALPLPPVGDVSLDYGGSAASDRNAAENALRTVVAQAKREALSTHRGTRVSALVPLRADVDLDCRIEIDTETLRASGKAARVRHRMDMENGEHDTEIEIAVSGCAAVGLQDDDPVEPPAAPIDPTPAPGAAAYGCKCDMYVGQVFGALPFDDTVMIGFSTNAKAGAGFDVTAPAYPYALSVQAPEIEAAVRDPITLTTAADYAVAIPQDLFEVTVL